MDSNKLTVSRETIEENHGALVALDCGCVLTLEELYERGSSTCPCYLLWVEMEEYEDQGGTVVVFSPFDNKFIPPKPTPITEPNPNEPPAY